MRRCSGISLLLLTMSAAGCGDGAGGETGVQLAPPSPLTRDPRLNFLLAPCARGHHFDVNTADIDGILTETLLHGQRDALRRARSELAAREGGLDIAWRVMRRYWIHADGKNHIRNALDVAGLSNDPRAREMLVEALGHPMEDLRVVALRSMRKHGTAADWDAVRAALDQSTPPFVLEFVQVLHELDPERTARAILDWVEAGDLEALWQDILPLLASTTAPESLERCRVLWPKLPKGQAAPVLVAVARAGDEEARNVVRAWRDDESNTTLRRIMILALGNAQELDELAPALWNDGSPENRLLAMGFLCATPEITAHMREALTAGMNDPVDAVAVGCTVALAAIGDEGATERGLELLRDDSPGALQNALRVLRESLARDPELARRALNIVVQRFEDSAHRPLTDRALFLGAVGQIPSEAAVRTLLEQADSTGGRIQNQSAARWITMQAGNVGEPGHELLLARLLVEEDIERRIDLIEALSMRGGEQAREILLDYINGERATPYEILYAADRLVRIGPASAVAPVLKRVTLRVEQPDVRGALQCLLWSSYPGPPEPAPTQQPR